MLPNIKNNPWLNPWAFPDSLLKKEVGMTSYGLHAATNLSAKTTSIANPFAKTIAKIGAFTIDFLQLLIKLRRKLFLNASVLYG